MKSSKITNRLYLNILLGLLLIFSLSSFQNHNLADSTVTKISKEDVKKAFNQINKRNIHPRLFFNSDDIERIKKLYVAKDSIVTLGYNQMKNRADRSLSEPLLSYKLDDANLRITSIHAFSFPLADLVMMYQFTKEKKYADRAWLQLAKMVDYPDWGANRHFLDSGIASFEFALAYDGLFDYLSTNQKDSLKNAVLKQVLIPAQKLMAENVFWHKAKYNWNGICNGGLIMASLAMFEDDPDFLTQIIAEATGKLPIYINEFNPDGQSVEGLGYWAYGLRYTILALESMKRVLGTTFKVDDAPGFKKTGWFPIYMSGPVSTLNFGDDGIKNSKSLSFFWLAKNSNDAELAKRQYRLALQNKSVSWSDMIYYDPKLVSQKTTEANIPKEIYVREIEVMSLREDWQNDGLFIAMHGGDNKANHGHLDAGTFEIQGLGEVWANSDLGSDKYTYPGYFKKTVPDYMDQLTPIENPGRWHFYRLRAEGKNAIVINPDTRPDQNPLGVAKLLDKGANKNSGFYVIDLSDCYKRDVSSYHRGIKLDRTNRTIEIQDEIKALNPSTIWWSMHTKADIKIIDGGKSAILQIGKQKMLAKIIGNKDAKFCELPATYLPSQSFPLTHNSVNKGFKKLAIELKNTKDLIMRVDFTPFNENHKDEPVSFLADWKNQ
nr:hypothetical protein [uncultured Pedobacter sp.]